MTFRQKRGKWLISKLPFNRRTFDILRFEIGCISRRLLNAVNLAYHWKVRALRAQSGLSINFGSGGMGHAGWINIDARFYHADQYQYIAYDIRRPLPFRDGQVKRIFAEHVIEHLDFRDDIPGVFQEFYRILEQGGVVRIIVPDAERYLNAYVHRSPEKFAALSWNLNHLPDDIYTPMHIINLVFHQNGEHLFGWDWQTMEWALKRAGFSMVVRKNFRNSRDPELAIDEPNHAPYSLYVEAYKVGTPNPAVDII